MYIYQEGGRKTTCQMDVFNRKTHEWSRRQRQKIEQIRNPIYRKIPRRDTKPQSGVGTSTKVPEWQINAEIRKLHRLLCNDNYEVNEKDDEKGK